MFKDAAKKPTLFFMVIALAIVTFNKFTANDQAIELLGPYKVDYVIDGDTVIIHRQSQKEKLRLIGIDTPERDEPYYDDATEFTRDLLQDKMVYLEIGAEPYDKYGRTLCYIYLDDKQSMANELIMRAGWAEVLTIPPNDKYAIRFKRARRDAQFNGRGMY